MNKVIRDGKVAVLYSPGFGAGWSTWDIDYTEELMYDPELVKLVEDGASAATIEQYAMQTYPDVYTGGAKDLTIAWIPVGRQFRINEYDGSESIVTPDEGYWYTA